jgi:uncharacterized protein (TIGR02452 family)
LQDIARENIAIYEAGKYTNAHGDEVDISDANKAAAASGVTYPPSHVFPASSPGSLPGSLEFTNETTTAALRRLIESEGDPSTVGLNFANPELPGGLFEGGAIAQEEALCRCSTLYNLLCLHREMYDNVDKNGNLYTDYMSLIRGVPMSITSPLRRSPVQHFIMLFFASILVLKPCDLSPGFSVCYFCPQF